jgi:hypothetical protein
MLFAMAFYVLNVVQRLPENARIVERKKSVKVRQFFWDSLSNSRCARSLVLFATEDARVPARKGNQ